MAQFRIKNPWQDFTFGIPENLEVWLDANDFWKGYIWKRDGFDIFGFNIEELGTREGLEANIIGIRGGAGIEGRRILKEKYGIDFYKIPIKTYNITNILTGFGPAKVLLNASLFKPVPIEPSCELIVRGVDPGNIHAPKTINIWPCKETQKEVDAKLALVTASPGIVQSQYVPPLKEAEAIAEKKRLEEAIEEEIEKMITPAPPPIKPLVPAAKITEDFIKARVRAETKEMLEKIGRWPYQKLAKYPHMRPSDVAVWERFIAKYPNEYVNVDYDYHLGIGQAGLEDDPTSIAFGQKKVKKLKADAIAYRSDGSVDVIEIKPKTGTSAFGQIIAYGILYNQDFPSKKIVPVIITSQFHDDIKNLSDRLGIKIVVV